MEATTQMRDWVHEHGSPDQRARLEAGVLPFEEFLEAFADETFRSLEHLERYSHDGPQRLQAHLRRLGSHPDAVVAPAELSVVARLPSTATPAQWAVIQTRSVFERYNIVSVGDLREAARRLDIATGTISGTIEENRRSGSKV